MNDSSSDIFRIDLTNPVRGNRRLKRDLDAISSGKRGQIREYYIRKIQPLVELFLKQKNSEDVTECYRITQYDRRGRVIFTTDELFAMIGITIAYIINIFITLAGIKTSTALVCLIGGGILGLIGFVISSFKIPDSNNFELTRKTGGEYIDQIILRYFKFKRRHNKIYTFYTEDNKNER